MASIIFNNSVPGSHSQDAKRSQRVSASVQVVNEGDADGFAELVIMGALNGTSGVQRASRGGGGAYLTAYSNYISGTGSYRVSVILFEVVDGSRQTVLSRHDNFTANVAAPAPRGGGGWGGADDDEGEFNGNGNGNGNGGPPDTPPQSEEDDWIEPEPEPELEPPYYAPPEEDDYIPPYEPPAWETEPDWWKDQE